MTGIIGREKPKAYTITVDNSVHWCGGDTLFRIVGEEWTAEGVKLDLEPVDEADIKPDDSIIRVTTVSDDTESLDDFVDEAAGADA